VESEEFTNLSTMKVCANLSFMFTEEERLEDRYKAAAEAGFTAVEVAFPYNEDKNQLATLARNLGLRQILINTEPGDCLGYAAREGESEKFLESLKKSLDYCAALNCKMLHIMSGKNKDGVSRSEAMDVLERNLKVAIPLLEKAGVVGLIEPINPWSVPNYNMDSFSDGMEIVRKLNHPNIRLQMDIFHLQQLTGNICRQMEQLLPWVGHVQLAQVPHRGEPDSRGELDCKFVMDKLHGLGYQGWVGLEYKPVNGTREGLGWIKDWGVQL